MHEQLTWLKTGEWRRRCRMLWSAVKSIQIVQPRQDLIACEPAWAQSLQQPDLLDRVAKVVVAGRGHHLNLIKIIIINDEHQRRPLWFCSFMQHLCFDVAKAIDTLLTKDRLKFGLMTTSTSPPSMLYLFTFLNTLLCFLYTGLFNWRLILTNEGRRGNYDLNNSN